MVACSEEPKMILGGHKSRSVRSRGLRIRLCWLLNSIMFAHGNELNRKFQVFYRVSCNGPDET